MKDHELNVSPSPFVFLGLRLESAFVAVLLTLLPQIALMAAFRDTAALIVILASLIGAAAAELCFSSPVLGIGGRCKKFSDGAAVISGLVTGFLLPVQINPFFAGFASFFGLFISRNFFNGKGNAWINASALSVIFVFLSSMGYFSESAPFYSDAYLPAEGIVADFDYRITASINNILLKPLGIMLPEGYILLFFNPGAPVAALKFNIVTIASSVVLIALDIVDWIVPTVFFAVYAAGIYFFPSLLYPLYYAGTGGNVLFALFSGGIFFAVFYLLSDFSSLPRTRTGRVLLGFLAGITAVFACGQDGASVPGAAFTVFAANLLSTAIEYAENRILRVFSTRNVFYDKY